MMVTAVHALTDDKSTPVSAQKTRKNDVKASARAHISDSEMPTFNQPALAIRQPGCHIQCSCRAST
jgi:hypothetical protein